MAMQAMVWTLGARGGKEHNDIVYMGENWAPSEGEQATLTRSRGELSSLGSDRYSRRQIQRGISNQT